jgi:hypothetical protein
MPRILRDPEGLTFPAFSVVKTRMQSLDARVQYRNSFHCIYRTFTEEGILRFWTGTTPRLARLVISGGVTFSVYEVCLSYHLFAALKERLH